MNVNNLGLIYTATEATGLITTTTQNSAISGQYITSYANAVTSVANGKLYLALELDSTLTQVASGTAFLTLSSNGAETGLWADVYGTVFPVATASV